MKSKGGRQRANNWHVHTKVQSVYNSSARTEICLYLKRYPRTWGKQIISCSKMQLNQITWNPNWEVHLRNFAIAIITSSQKDSFKSLANWCPKSSKKNNIVLLFFSFHLWNFFFKIHKDPDLFLSVNLMKREPFKI